MSSPILPAQSLLGSPNSTSTHPAATTEIGDVGAFIDGLANGVGSLSVDVTRGAPPPELLAQIAATAHVAERMRENGYEVRFFDSADSAPTRIELHDGDGNVLSTLSAAEALELATGELPA
ncbi:MAG TPA: hypothetical protein VKV16_05650 [Solirubrobacteraceae bacterium]|nr:hypothetical protein [Solirubrobacteraceae bacterium]